MKNQKDLDWEPVYGSLNDRGFAAIPSCLSKEECASLISLYPENIYRNVIDMQRYRFGRGEYKYFNYPLPALVQSLRDALYAPLAVIANQWSQLITGDSPYPQTHSAFIAICNQKNQARPTPLILRYRQGGFNTLHQDLYGEVYFPFQVVFILSQQGSDYGGGELVMTEQLPRAQSRASVISPSQGDAVIFTTNFRPVQGARGHYKARMKHGVSEVTEGERFALGIVFHDAT